jgi:hypothetical protein
MAQYYIKYRTVIDQIAKSVIDSKAYESKLNDLKKREPTAENTREKELTEQILFHIREQIEMNKSLLSVYQDRLELSN